jgi:hypothetical protein
VRADPEGDQGLLSGGYFLPFMWATPGATKLSLFGVWKPHPHFFHQGHACFQLYLPSHIHPLLNKVRINWHYRHDRSLYEWQEMLGLNMPGAFLAKTTLPMNQKRSTIRHQIYIFYQYYGYHNSSESAHFLTINTFTPRPDFLKF